MLTRKDVLADDGLFRKSAAIVRANIGGLSAMLKVKELGFTGFVNTALLCATHATVCSDIMRLRARPAIRYTKEGERQYSAARGPVIATLGPGGVVL